MIYTTNAIESVNYSLRKLTRHRGAFPSDEALVKLLYLALRNISKKWTMPIRDWKAALNQFTIRFEERLPSPGRVRFFVCEAVWLGSLFQRASVNRSS